MNIRTLKAIEELVNHTTASITEQSTRKRLDAKALATAAHSRLCEILEQEIEDEVKKRLHSAKQE